MLNGLEEHIKSQWYYTSTVLDMKEMEYVGVQELQSLTHSFIQNIKQIILIRYLCAKMVLCESK